jgi:hypothetical protein
MASPILKYQSGEEIRKGDRVLFHGNGAEIELVACDADDAKMDWYIQEFGGGVLILDPLASGRTFIPSAQLEEFEDLRFVSRG